MGVFGGGVRGTRGVLLRVGGREDEVLPDGERRVLAAGGERRECAGCADFSGGGGRQ